LTIQTTINSNFGRYTSPDVASQESGLVDILRASCDSLESFGNVIDEFLGLLDSHIGRVTSNWKETGVYIAVTNVASLFSYGAKDAKFRLAFVQAIKSHLKQAQRASMAVEHALQQDVESVLPLALRKGNKHPSLLPHATQERLGNAAEFEIGAP